MCETRFLACRVSVTFADGSILPLPEGWDAEGVRSAIDIRIVPTSWNANSAAWSTADRCRGDGERHRDSHCLKQKAGSRALCPASGLLSTAGTGKENLQSQGGGRSDFGLFYAGEQNICFCRNQTLPARMICILRGRRGVTGGCPYCCLRVRTVSRRATAAGPLRAENGQHKGVGHGGGGGHRMIFVLLTAVDGQADVRRRCGRGTGGP